MPDQVEPDTVAVPAELLVGYEDGYQEGWSQALTWAGLGVKNAE